MINLNITLFVQLINFLALLFILNAILYKPILAKIREREAAIKSDQEKAGELEKRVADQETRHQEELAKTRQTAAQEKTALLAEAKGSEAEILNKAKAEAGATTVLAICFVLVCCVAILGVFINKVAPLE